jgi:lysophospholipase L1-like esterase
MIRTLRWWMICHWLAALGAPALLAAPLKVLAIGDSLTEEYAFELPFSAPDSDPLDANTENWPEILSGHRADTFTVGSYNSTLFSYRDLRNGGYLFNYGVPGFRTWDWIAVCQSTFLDLISSDPVIVLRYPTKQAILGHLDNVDAVVIFLGGNDVESVYGGIFNDAQPPALLAQTVSNLAFIHDYVRNHGGNVPIIIATVPDVGATEKIASKYTDPAKRVTARARIAAMNASIMTMAASRGATVARIDTVTDRIFDQVPMNLNGTGFIYPPSPENSPRPVFCKDGFHPATMVQALIADQILAALNLATGRNIPRLSPREILGPVLGLNPDQPYLDWAAGAGGFDQNPDGDGLPNLAEFVLATSPTTAGSPFIFEADGLMRFSTSAAGLEFASLTVEESTALTSWLPVPSARIAVGLDGVWQIAPSAASRTFYRLAAVPKP